MGLLLGYDAKGDPVEIPLTHTVISAITGGGKTEAVKALIAEAVRQGKTVLAIDVKAKPRDFLGIGPETKPFIIESTDPLLVLRMLESIAGVSLFRHFNVLLDACMDTKSLVDVLSNLEAVRDNKKASPWKRDGAKTLAYMMLQLMKQVRAGEYADDLRLERGKANVMDVSSLPEGVQQLVVDSAFRRLLEGKWQDVIVVLEEAINFIPQMEKTQFETSARRFIREGRSANLFLWALGQALTEMDVHVRKQMRVWILGAQAEENEAEKFRRQVPMKGVTTHDVMMLATGWFYVAVRTEDAVHVHNVYAKPTWLSALAAVQIARGEKPVSWAKKQKVVHVDQDERERYETTLKEYEGRLRETEQKVKDLQVLLNQERTKRETAEEKLKPKFSSVHPIPSPPSPATPIRAAVRLPPGSSAEGLIPDLMVTIRTIAREEIAKAGRMGGIVEVPAKRVILSTFLEGHVARIQEPLAKLPDRAKRYLALLSTKDTWQGTKSIAVALFGYGSDAAAIAKALAETGAVEYDSQHGRVQYCLPETLRKDLQGTYEISDEELAQIHAALQHEFLGFVKGAAE